MDTDDTTTTVVELGPGEVGMAAPLFAGAWADRAYIDAVLEGRAAGRVLVDRLEGPRSALMARSYEYFLAGEPVAAMRRFVAEAPAEADVFRFLYGYVSFDEAWVEALREDAPTLGTIGRRTFVLDAARWAGIAGRRAELPAGIALAPLDAELARRADEELDEVIGLMWGGHAAFAEQGFGTVAVESATGRLVSVCAALGRSDAEANLGVASHPAHRRRGLASLCCRAAIGQALALGLAPTWDCDAANPPSAALARSLGFRELASFVELAYPRRGAPTPSTGLWTSAPGEGGSTVWRRAG